MSEIKWYRCIYLNSAKDKLCPGCWYSVNPECTAEVHVNSMIMLYDHEPLWDIETCTDDQCPSDIVPYVNAFN